MNRKWWKETVVYQIYPRSFYDSNGDGIGDLRGIIEKIDYLAELGIGAVWLNPIYCSPNDDMGYDISDYQGILREFGTLDDFDELLRALHERGIKLIMDLVVNHSSDEHPWFVESRASKDSGKRDFYIWKDGKNGKEPNNWASFFTPSAWQYDAVTGQYYLHLFSTKQPDLNWQNERVRKEVFDMMNWWVARGVDGFRMDVINLIDKAEGLPDSDEKPGLLGYCFDARLFADRERVHDYLREMHEKVFADKDLVSIGETPFVTPQVAARYVDEGEQKLNMLFSFDMMDIDSGAAGKWEIVSFELAKMKDIITRWQFGLANGWNSLFWSNHDQPRVVSRFGDPGEYRVRSAKMLGLVLHLLKGTPFIYQGEEIGMTNMPFGSIDEINDIESLLFYKNGLNAGKPQAELWSAILRKGRDNARTPMQWNANAHGGFTTGTPWQKVNPNCAAINVAQSLKDEHSVFHFYKKLIRLRKENLIVPYGSYAPVLEEHKSILAYLRELEHETWLVAANFSEAQTAAALPNSVEVIGEVLSNVDESLRLKNGCLTLAPYEARVLRLHKKSSVKA